LSSRMEQKYRADSKTFPTTHNIICMISALSCDLRNSMVVRMVRCAWSRVVWSDRTAAAELMKQSFLLFEGAEIEGNVAQRRRQDAARSTAGDGL
jgi:hypothetical protein